MKSSDISPARGPGPAALASTTARKGALASSALMLATVLATALAATASAPRVGDARAHAKYVGNTSQDGPALLKLSRRGLKLSLGWRARCDDGGRPFSGTTFNRRPLALRRNGSFSVKASFGGRAVDGVRVRYRVALSGRVRARAARGTWKISVSGPSTAGGTYTCATDKLRWTTKRSGRPAKRATAASAAGNALGLQTRTSSKGSRTPPGPGSSVPAGGGSNAPPPSPPGGSATSPPTPTPPTRTPNSVSGEVLYTTRDCYRDASGTTPPGRWAPLGSAWIRLVPSSGSPVLAKLDDNGRFDAQLDPSASYDAVAVLDSPRISVGPDATPSEPYEIPLGPVTQSNQRFVIGAGTNDTTPDPAEGAANIFAVLQRGARAAATAAPVSLPPVHARWRYASDLAGWLGDRSGSSYGLGEDVIYVGGERHGGWRDEFAAFSLLHEYGHHVIDHVASPPDAKGGHHVASVHRDKPTIPLKEGFAHSFAAVVLDDPKLTLGCSVRMDLSAKPAQADPPEPAGEPDKVELKPLPAAAEEHLAQYNETAVAGALWENVNVLGSGVPAAGLNELLGAMKSFKDKYHGPRDMRELRDALTEFADRQQTHVQQQIGNAFDDNRLRWGFKAEVLSYVPAPTGYGQLKLWAKGASCDQSQPFMHPGAKDQAFTGPDEKDQQGVLIHQTGWAPGGSNPGPLTYTGHDECWLAVRGVYISDDERQTLIQTLPYRPGQAHRGGKTTIYAVWDCGSGFWCPDTTATISVGTGIWHRPGGGQIASAAPLKPQTVSVRVPGYGDSRPIPLSAAVAVAEIDALGNCKTLVGANDCGS